MLAAVVCLPACNGDDPAITGFGASGAGGSTATTVSAVGSTGSTSLSGAEMPVVPTSGLGESGTGSSTGGPAVTGTTGEPAVTGTTVVPVVTGTTGEPGTTGTTGPITTTTGGGAVCGDGIKDAGEACDVADFGGLDCAGLGFGGGTLHCNNNCKIDTLGCYTCGDGVVHPAEACDGDNFGQQTCASLGLGAGTLSCADDCQTIDTSGCTATPMCGDGVVNAPMEACDGMDLGGQTCVSQGFETGTLGCTIACQFDTTGCSKTCKLKGEPCMGPDDCCNTGCGKGGLTCMVNGMSMCCT